MAVEKLSPYTRLAVQTFQRIARMQTRLEMLEEELNYLITKIPDEDWETYIKLTEEIREREERKLETYLERLERKMKRLGW